MIRSNLKKYILRISLIVILLISVLLCVHAVGNYNKNNTMTQNNQLTNNGGPSLQNKNSQFEQSGNDTLPNGNEQPGLNENKQSGSNGNREQKDSGDKQPGLNGNRDQKGNGDKQPGQNGNMNRGSADSKYDLALTTYCVMFLILSLGSYYLVKQKSIQINFVDEKMVIFTLLAAGFLLRIAASTLMEGYAGDINYFKTWASSAANNLSQIYLSPKAPDYPPVYLYVLALIGKIMAIPAFNSYYVLLLKLPAIIADIITSYFIYRIGKKHFTPIVSIFLSAFYIFNPAIFIDSTFWGQVDSLFTLIIIFAIYLLSEKKIVFSSMVFTLAVLMKPQGIIFLPVLFFELVRKKRLINFIYAAISAMITALIIILPFSLNGESPLWIFKLYLSTIGEYPYASVNAFNFFSLIGANMKNDSLPLFIFSYHTIGMIFIVITTLTSWFVYIKGNNRNLGLAISILQIAGVFTFSAGMHERYLFSAVAIGILAFIKLRDRRFIILAIGFSITSYINIYTVLFKISSSDFNIALKLTSLLNVILVIYLVKVLFNNAVKKKESI